MIGSSYSENTPEIRLLSELAQSNGTFEKSDYTRWGVMRGLRDQNGKGVLAGLTDISQVVGMEDVDGARIPCEGVLRYRGYDVRDLVQGCVEENRFGFEETAWLLLFGQLPCQQELADFQLMLEDYRSLPSNFVRDVIMKAASRDMMNTLARCVLTNAAYDDAPDDISLPNVTRQCVQLLAKFPQFAVHGYRAYRYSDGGSLVIRSPQPGLSTAENILAMLRPDGSYTPLEARLLDLCLILHAEHGGGNNSAFTMHVVTSSGTDTYSAFAASLASLKGPRHGGANGKVVKMMADMQETLGRRRDDASVRDYLHKLLGGEAFDRKGLIYGMGHAVYSVSDPRAVVLKQFAEKLSKEKGREDEYALYAQTERLASEIICSERKIYKGVCANVDLYSGLVYHMLGIPQELYTPLFAIARCAGWGAHRIEELINMGKIIRPAYQCVCPPRVYESMSIREDLAQAQNL